MTKAFPTIQNLLMLWRSFHHGLQGKGFIHIGAELYQFTGDTDKAVQELTELLESWKN